MNVNGLIPSPMAAAGAGVGAPAAAGAAASSSNTPAITALAVLTNLPVHSPANMQRFSMGHELYPPKPKRYIHCKQLTPPAVVNRVATPWKARRVGAKAPAAAAVDGKAEPDKKAVIGQANLNGIVGRQVIFTQRKYPNNQPHEFEKYRELERKYKTFFHSPMIRDVGRFSYDREDVDLYGDHVGTNILFENDRAVLLKGSRGFAICIQGVRIDDGKPNNYLRYFDENPLNEFLLKTFFQFAKLTFKPETLKVSIVGGTLPYSDPLKSAKPKEEDESYPGTYEEEVLLLNLAHKLANEQGIPFGVRLHYTPIRSSFYVLVHEGKVFCSRNEPIDTSTYETASTSGSDVDSQISDSDSTEGADTLTRRAERSGNANVEGKAYMDQSD